MEGGYCATINIEIKDVIMCVATGRSTFLGAHIRSSWPISGFEGEKLALFYSHLSLKEVQGKFKSDSLNSFIVCTTLIHYYYSYNMDIYNALGEHLATGSEIKQYLKK